MTSTAPVDSEHSPKPTGGQDINESSANLNQTSDNPIMNGINTLKNNLPPMPDNLPGADKVKATVKNLFTLESGTNSNLVIDNTTNNFLQELSHNLFL